MTLFAAILRRLGLSQPEAAEYLDVRLDTIKSWSSGRRKIPDGVFDQLRDMADHQRLAVRAAYKSWINKFEVDPASIDTLTYTDILGDPDGAVLAALWERLSLEDE